LWRAKQKVATDAPKGAQLEGAQFEREDKKRIISTDPDRIL
jgi:hypothetical protein